MSSFEKRIEILATFRSQGRRVLNALPQLSRTVRSTFRRSLTNAYRDQLVERLMQGEEYVDEHSLHQNAGIGIDTARRILDGNGGKSVEFANWLSIVHVFQIPWRELEVESRRDVVIEAMLTVLTLLRAGHGSTSVTDETADDSTTDCDGHARLTRQQWECLRRIHLSSEWLDASRIADEQRRHAELIGVAQKTIHDLSKELAEAGTTCEITEPEDLVKLVSEWHVAWTAFFGAVNCRWRF